MRLRLVSKSITISLNNTYHRINPSTHHDTQGVWSIKKNLKIPNFSNVTKVITKVCLVGNFGILKLLKIKSYESVGVFAHDLAVLAGPGLTLIGIDDEKTWPVSE